MESIEDFPFIKKSSWEWFIILGLKMLKEFHTGIYFNTNILKIFSLQLFKLFKF